jgi:integrase
MIDTMKEKGLAPRTVKHAHSILGRALNQAVKWRILVSNPARYVDLPKQVRKEMKVLPPKQARLFLRACEANRFGLIFEVALMSGMRQRNIWRSNGLIWTFRNARSLFRE